MTKKKKNTIETTKVNFITDTKLVLNSINHLIDILIYVSTSWQNFRAANYVGLHGIYILDIPPVQYWSIFKQMYHSVEHSRYIQVRINLNFDILKVDNSVEFLLARHKGHTSK